jgi:hypothetical protein
MRACEAADASADAKSVHSGYPETVWMGIHTPFILDETVSPGQLRQRSNKNSKHVIKNLFAKDCFGQLRLKKVDPLRTTELKRLELSGQQRLV